MHRLNLRPVQLTFELTAKKQKHNVVLSSYTWVIHLGHCIEVVPPTDVSISAFSVIIRVDEDLGLL